MAIDLAVLENADQICVPTVRVYQWQPYCISLGYYQAVDHIDLTACEQNHIDVVRRPTGGRAVFHAEELTYSVVIPKTHSAYQDRVGALYNRISRALVCGLRKYNIPAILTKQSLNINRHYQSALSASCFSAAARHEVLLNNRKLIGSAQRHLTKGVLQHGSILTGDAHLSLVYYLKDGTSGSRTRMRERLKEKTATLSQYLEQPVEICQIKKSLKQGFEEVFSIQFQESDLHDVELKRLDVLRKTSSVYTTSESTGSVYQKAS